MIKDGIGGAKTRVGLDFESRVDLLSMFASTPGYSVKDNYIFSNKKEVAVSIKKNNLYRFLEKHDVDYKSIISKKLLPDEALYIPGENKIFIIEIKFQEVAGSVDEKLQTCDFKKRQYQKLFKPLGMSVEYVYILSDWFKKDEYRDVLGYITDVGCYYFFKTLPLDFLGLPIPEK